MSSGLNISWAFFGLVAFGIFHGAVNQAEVDKRNITKIAKANTYLALDLYRRYTFSQEIVAAREEKSVKNFCFCPLCITSVHLMLLIGLQGRTADEIWTFLGYEKASINSEDAITEYSAFLEQKVRVSSWPAHSILDIKHNVVVDKKFQLKDEYKKKVEDALRATVQTHDPNWLTFINLMTKNNTRLQIEKIFDSPTKEKVKMILHNTAYFRGKWMQDFAVKKEEETFYCQGKNEKKVKMLKTKGTISYFESHNEYALDISIRGDRVSLFLTWPKKRTELVKIEETLSLEKITDMRKRMKKIEMELLIPKLKMQFSRKLGYDLHQMQIGKIFLPDAVSFQGISPLTGISVDFITHISTMEMHEESITATGVTAIGIQTEEVIPSRKERKVQHDFVKETPDLRQHKLRSESSAHIKQNLKTCMKKSKVKQRSGTSPQTSASLKTRSHKKACKTKAKKTHKANCKSKRPNLLSGKASAKPPKQVKVDRPFVFAVIESDLNMIWFMGRIAECPPNS